VDQDTSAWLKHERFTTSEIDLPSAAHKSWANGISFIAESRDAEGRLLRPGLRNAQVGALHAVAAHWTVSTKPALIVMPTGTGKTDGPRGSDI
jgi:superfamily II DNA or RNA helicase